MAYRFFKDDGSNFALQLALGGVYCGCGDAGEILAVASKTGGREGPDMARAWTELADRLRVQAAEADTAGDVVSARSSYLRSSSYYAAASNAVVDDEDQLQSTFASHRSCWDLFAARHQPPFEQVEIPYEDTTLPGYLMKATDSDRPRPTIVMNNGSDGPISSMWMLGAAGALARGYHALSFDGPGQQSMLFQRGTPFRPDWERVITPVVDFLSGRPDVDSEQLVLWGVSQGGYWVPRALAFERRFVAAIADPGVVDVSTTWVDKLPSRLVKLLDAGDRRKFERQMATAMRFLRSARRQLAIRSRPYCKESLYDVFVEVRRYNVEDVVDRITTPLLITDPEEEQFWPGQSRRLYDLLPGPKKLVPFLAAEGADGHCEPMARTLVDERVYTWLEGLISSRDD